LENCGSLAVVLLLDAALLVGFAAITFTGLVISTWLNLRLANPDTWLVAHIARLDQHAAGYHCETGPALALDRLVAKNIFSGHRRCSLALQEARWWGGANSSV
jgi:hypothetical protein